MDEELSTGLARFGEEKKASDMRVRTIESQLFSVDACAREFKRVGEQQNYFHDNNNNTE